MTATLAALTAHAAESRVAIAKERISRGLINGGGGGSRIKKEYSQTQTRPPFVEFLWQSPEHLGLLHDACKVPVKC